MHKRPIIVLIPMLIFLGLSLWMHQDGLFISSFDAKALLNESPRIVDWKKIEKCPDCIIQAEKIEGQDNLYQSLIPPRLFSYVGETKIPLLFQLRTGGLPYFIMKSLVSAIGPKNAHFLINVFLSSLSLLFMFLSLKNLYGEKLAIKSLYLFAFYPIFSFFYPLWVETQWAVFLFWLAFYCISLPKKRHLVLAGVCIGLAFHIKNASIVLTFPLLLISIRKIKRNGLYLGMGLLPFFLLQAYINYFYFDPSQEFIHQRTYIKDFIYYLRALSYALQFYASPEILFEALSQSFSHPFLKPNDYSFFKTGIRHIFQLIIFLISFFTTMYYLIKEERRFAIAFILSLSMGLTIIRPDNDPIDLLSYFTYPLIFFMLGKAIYLYQYDKSKVPLFFAALWIGSSIFSWSYGYKTYKNKSTSYEKWAKNLNQELIKVKKNKLYTLCQNNIGLLELFLPKNIQVIHLNWEMNNLPKNLELNDAVERIKNAALLVPAECTGNDLPKWLKGVRQEKISRSMGAILKTYRVNPGEKYFLLNIP